MNLSLDWIEFLKGSGHEAVHWSLIGRADAADQEIMLWAEENAAVILTNDLDFGYMLTIAEAEKPSVIQIPPLT